METPNFLLNVLSLLLYDAMRSIASAAFPLQAEDAVVIRYYALHFQFASPCALSWFHDVIGVDCL